MLDTHPDDVDRETAASDIIADILTAIYGPAGAWRDGRIEMNDAALLNARQLLDRALRSYEGDAEDYEAEPLSPHLEARLEKVREGTKRLRENDDPGLMSGYTP